MRIDTSGALAGYCVSLQEDGTIIVVTQDEVGGRITYTSRPRQYEKVLDDDTFRMAMKAVCRCDPKFFGSFCKKLQPHWRVIMQEVLREVRADYIDLNKDLRKWERQQMMCDASVSMEC